MTNFKFLSTISESKLIPNQNSLKEFDTDELSELSFLYILSLRIILSESISKDFGENYCKKTIQHHDFKKWRVDATDLYVMLHAITSDETKKNHTRIDASLIKQWFEYPHKDEITHHLFVKLDDMFKIKESALRATRRLVMDWTTIKTHDKKLALTKLLHLMRTKAPKSELLPQLNKIANKKDLELNVHQKKEVKENILLTLETASGGSTSAASIAVVPGGLGAGFDADYSKSVYPPPKTHQKEKPKRSLLISREKNSSQNS